MAKVIGLRLVGGAYKRGMYMRGWCNIHLDNGSSLFHGGENGMIKPLDHADSLGHDTKEIRERLDKWVKTGIMPEHMGT